MYHSMDTQSYTAGDGIPPTAIPHDTEPAISEPKVKSTKPVYAEEELALAKAQFEGMQISTPGNIRWVLIKDDDEAFNRELRRIVRDNRRDKKAAAWWGWEHDSALAKIYKRLSSRRRFPSDDGHFPHTNAIKAHMWAADARIPLSPSVHSSSGASEAESSESDHERHTRLVDNRDRKAAQNWSRYRHDHHRACGGATRSVTKEPFRFMELPPEIRLHILRLLLERGKEMIHFSEVRRMHFNPFPVDVRLFAVNRRVKAEAEQVFYRWNTFLIDTDEPPPFVLRHAIDRPGINAKATLRDVHIRVSHYCHSWDSLAGEEASEWRNFFKHKLETIAEALKSCTHLARIQITPLCQIGQYQENRLSRDFDELLECFTKIRGVGKVVFTDPETIEEKERSKLRPLGWWAWGSTQQTERLKAIMESPSP